MLTCALSDIAAMKSLGMEQKEAFWRKKEEHFREAVVRKMLSVVPK
jgi:hypothetical protein